MLKFGNTPTPKQLAFVTDNQPFQSPSCLLGCIRPSNFASVSWDKKVNYCSYSKGKEKLKSLDFKGIEEALSKVNWKCCQEFIL